MTKVATYRNDLAKELIAESPNHASLCEMAARLSCEIDAHMPGLSDRGNTVASLIDRGWYDTAADVLLTFIPGK